MTSTDEKEPGLPDLPISPKLRAELDEFLDWIEDIARTGVRDAVRRLIVRAVEETKERK
jgi:hypothetical protein